MQKPAAQAPLKPSGAPASADAFIQAKAGGQAGPSGGAPGMTGLQTFTTQFYPNSGALPSNVMASLDGFSGFGPSVELALNEGLVDPDQVAQLQVMADDLHAFASMMQAATAWDGSGDSSLSHGSVLQQLIALSQLQAQYNLLSTLKVADSMLTQRTGIADPNVEPFLELAARQMSLLLRQIDEMTLLPELQNPSLMLRIQGSGQLSAELEGLSGARPGLGEALSALENRLGMLESSGGVKEAESMLAQLGGLRQELAAARAETLDLRLALGLGRPEQDTGKLATDTLARQIFDASRTIAEAKASLRSCMGDVDARMAQAIKSGSAELQGKLNERKAMLASIQNQLNAHEVRLQELDQSIASQGSLQVLTTGAPGDLAQMVRVVLQHHRSIRGLEPAEVGLGARAAFRSWLVGLDGLLVLDAGDPALSVEQRYRLFREGMKFTDEGVLKALLGEGGFKGGMAKPMEHGFNGLAPFDRQLDAGVDAKDPVWSKLRMALGLVE